MYVLLNVLLNFLLSFALIHHGINSTVLKASVASDRVSNTGARPGRSNASSPLRSS
jgi:hypothetical protein